MNTLAWVLIGVAAYLGVLVMTLALVIVAKRSDEDRLREFARRRSTLASAAAPGRTARVAGVEASNRWLGRRIVDFRGITHAERIAVALRDPDDPDAWSIQACAGLSDVLGLQVAAAGQTTARRPSIASLLSASAGLQPARRWSVASFQLTIEGAPVGEIAAATCRPGGFSARDIAFLHQLAELLVARLPTEMPAVVGRSTEGADQREDPPNAA